MRVGKLPEPVLKRSVLKQIRWKQNPMEKNVGVGCDAGICVGTVKGKENSGSAGRPPDSDSLAAAEAVVLGTAQSDLYFGGHSAANNLWAAGYVPMWVTVTLLLPENFEEPKLRQYMSRICDVCAGAGMEIVGGHTQTLQHLLEPVLNLHAMGLPFRQDFPMQSVHRKVRAGDAILMTKYIARDGAAKWLETCQEQLRGRFSASFLEEAKQAAFGERQTASSSDGAACGKGFSGASDGAACGKGFSGASDGAACGKGFPGASDGAACGNGFPDASVGREAAIALEYGVKAMHDVGNGGIFGALWELGERELCGMEIDLKAIPVQQETIELCEYFGRNPYHMKSTGSLLIVAEQPEPLLIRLREAGIPTAVLGHITGGKEKLVRNGEEIRYLDLPKQDESP